MSNNSPRTTIRNRLSAVLLIVLLTVVGIMIAAEWRPAARRRAFAEEIRTLNGGLGYVSAKASAPQTTGAVRSWLQLILGSEYFAEVDYISLEPRSADDVRLILAFPETQKLELRGDAVTPNFLGNLEPLVNLNSLRLQKARLGKQSVEAFQHHPNLFTLHFKQCTISLELLSTLKEISSVVALTFEQCEIAENGWSELHGSQSDVTLEITKQVVSEADILAMHSANPNWSIRFASPAGKDVMDRVSFLPSVNNLPNASGLELRGPLVTEATLIALKDARNLTSLVLAGCSLSDNSLTYLSQFPSLNHLMIYDIPITDQCTPSLAALSELKKLHCVRTRIEGRAFGSLPPTVKELVLNPSVVTNEGVASIAKLPSLELLSLGSSSISDACESDLSKIKSLRYLELWNTPLSLPAQERLKNALPGCEVTYNRR